MRMAGHRHRAHERSIRRSRARIRIKGIYISLLPGSLERDLSDVKLSFFADRSQGGADRQDRHHGIRSEQEDPPCFSTGSHDFWRSSTTILGRPVRGDHQQQNVLLRHHHHEGLSKLFVRGTEVHVAHRQEIEREYAGQAQRRWQLQCYVDTILGRLVLADDHGGRLQHGGCA